MLEEVSKAAGQGPAAFFISVRPEGKRGGCGSSMNINTTSASLAEMSALEILEQAASLYREAAVELFAAVKVAKRGQFEGSKAAMQAVKDLKTALEWVMDERNRLEKFCRSAAGTAGATELDFGVARDEIGRRLACIRDAGGR